MQFSKIYGQRETINKLTSIVDAGRIPHAQLFLGAEGSQSLALAIGYAQYLNCEHPQHFPENNPSGLRADSCGHCPSCIKYNDLAHPDLHFFYPNNTGEHVKKDSTSLDYIDQWRELIQESNASFALTDWYKKMEIGNKQGTINVRDCSELIHLLSFKAFEAKYKVFVIWMVDKLFHAAAPRILKVLEEPTDNTVFLLVAESQDLILNTILSRSQLVKIPKMQAEEIAEALISEYQIPSPEAMRVAIQAEGNLVAARNIHENNESQTFNHEKFVTWMRLCIQMKVADLSDFASEMNKIGRENLKSFFQNALREIRASFLISSGHPGIMQLQDEEKAFLKNFAPFIKPDNVEQFSELLNQAIHHIERNANANILMMDLSIKIGGLLKNAK